MSKSRTQLLSAQVARMLNSVAIRTLDLDLESLVRAYRGIEHDALALCAPNKRLQLEASRRVAESILCTAAMKEASAATCGVYFADLSKLGFTDLERKATAFIIYARCLLRTGLRSDGIVLLEELRLELVKEQRRSRALLYRELMRTTEDVLGLLKERPESAK